MQPLRLTMYRVSLVTFVVLLIALPLSSAVGISVGLKKTNSATGLTAQNWEASVVYGLAFVSKYSSTLGVPVVGSYTPEAGLRPATTEFYIQAKPFTVDLTPYLSFAATPYAGNNGMSSVAMPLWPAALLSSLYPAVRVARRASARWRKGGADRRRIVLLFGLAVGVVVLVLVAARALQLKRQSAGFADARFDEFYHQMDTFATILETIAWDNDGTLPCKTLPEAIAAVERGSSTIDRDVARTRCPEVLQGRDPWGQPIIYEWSNGGRNVSLKSLGPPGCSRPIYLTVSIEKRAY